MRNYRTGLFRNTRIPQQPKLQDWPFSLSACRQSVVSQSELLDQLVKAFPIVALALASLVALLSQQPHRLIEELIQAGGVAVDAEVIIAHPCQLQTLGMGVWLDLTLQGLSPCKKRQAYLAH